MKHLKLFSAIVLAILTMAGCDKKQTGSQSVTFAIEEQTVNAAVEGGSYSVNYTLENADPSDLKFTVDEGITWITDINAGKPGTITFTVLENESAESRKTSISAEIGGKSDSFEVIQSGKEDVNNVFLISVTASEYNSIAVSVTPPADDMPYVALIAEKEYYDLFDSEDALFADDMALFSMEAKNAGMSVEEYVASILNYGKQDKSFGKLKPETEYIVYAYGLDTELVRLTPYSSVAASTTEVQMLDMTFESDIVVDGINASVTITPSDNTETYYFDICEKSKYTDNGTASFQEFVEQVIKQQMDATGLGREEVIARMLTTGAGTYDYTNLKPLTEYYLLAGAVDGAGIVRSEIMSTVFQTENPGSSENDINITISDVGSSIATYDITTTNNDTYCFVVMESMYFEEMTDEEIIEYFISYAISYNTYSGNLSGRLTELTPETEYTAFIFGHVEGIATTGLQKVTFTTEAAQPGTAGIRVYVDSYFDGNEVAAAYPEFSAATGYAACVLTYEITEGTASFVRYMAFQASAMDIPEETLLFNLQLSGQTEPDYFFLTPFDTPLALCGIAYDEKGNIQEIFRELVTLTKEGVSPIEDFDPDIKK